MTDSKPIFQLADDELCLRLDAALAQLPPAPVNPNAPQGQAAVDFLRRTPLPAAVRDDLAAAVNSPVQVVVTGQWRVVVVLRMYAVAVERRKGFITAAQLRDDGRLTAIARPEPSVRLLNFPQGDRWPHYWLRSWSWRQGAVTEPLDLLHEVAGAAPALWRHAHRHLDLRAMRRQIAAAMDYQPVAWRRAVRLAHAFGHDPDQRHYNSTLLWAAQLDLLEREAPNLAAPWFALARGGALNRDQEPKAALKQWVRAAGGSERAWRSLAASPARAWTECCRQRNTDAIESLGETVRVVEACATGTPVPPPLLRALTGRLNPTEPLHTDRIGHYPFALRAAAAGDGWARFLDELDAVDSWFDDERPLPDKLQRRRGWPWLVRKARAWAEMRRRQQSARGPLIPALAPLEAGRYVFTAAHTPFDLWNAGRLLRNCVGRWDWQQAQSECLLVLATRRADSRLRAAIELSQPADGSALRVDQARGFANGPCPREVRLLLPRVVEHFEQLRRDRLLPWKFVRRRPAEPPLARCPMPLTVPVGSGELRLTVNGSVQIGQLLHDYIRGPIGERFEPMWLIRGGQAQLLAERAIDLASGKVETLDELAEAMAAVLSTPPALEYWLTAYGAFETDRNDDDAENFSGHLDDRPDELPLDATSREAVLDLLDHLARDCRERERRGKRQRSAA